MSIKKIFEKKSRQQFSKPYFIAEAGVNHEGSIEKAKKMIFLAKEAGADAIKFQTYKANLIAAKNSPYYWDLKKEKTKSQYELFKKYDKFWKKEYELLKNICDKEKIEFLSTPFDKTSALFLNDLVKAFKISSSDLNNHDFIRYICKFKKPIILSTGASTIKEIRKTVKIIKLYKTKLCLLHCILNYPTKDEDANLGMIIDLKNKFKNLPIGYSDHTTPNNSNIIEYAALLGATVIEKHFTYNKKLKGNDHYHSFDFKDLKNYNSNINNIVKIIGSQNKTFLKSEIKARQNARRSLVAFSDIKKGQKLKRKDLTWKRPASGISVEKLEITIGKVAKEFIPKDTIITKDKLK